MRRFRPGVWLAWLLLTALLVGCGQKGPLYLPKPTAQPASSEPSPPTKPSTQPADSKQSSPLKP